MIKYLLRLVLCALFVVGGQTSSFAQSAARVVKRAAKELKSEGWKAVDGRGQIEEQMLELVTRQLDETDGLPRYISGTRTASARDFVTARTLAFAQAKSDIAGQIKSEVSSICDAVCGDRVLSDNQTVQIDSMVESATVSVSRNIGSVDTIVELYRTLSPDCFEVRVTLTYDTEEMKTEIMRICSSSN